MTVIRDFSNDNFGDNQWQYMYARPCYYEIQESKARDIHVGVGLSYLFSLFKSTKK